MQRNTFGLGLPMREMMDRKICAEVSALPKFRLILRFRQWKMVEEDKCGKREEAFFVSINQDSLSPLKIRL